MKKTELREAIELKAQQTGLKFSTVKNIVKKVIEAGGDVDDVDEAINAYKRERHVIEALKAKAKQTGLFITTIKKIYKEASKQSTPQDRSKKFNELIEISLQNKSLKKKSNKKSNITILNSYLIFDLMSHRFNFTKCFTNFNNNITYRVISNPKDKYKTQVNVQAYEVNNTIFNGLTWQDVFTLNALYQAYKLNANALEQDYMRVGKEQMMYLKFKPVPLQEVFNAMYPGKRYDKLSNNQKNDILKSLAELKIKLNNIHVYFGTKSIDELDNGLYLLTFTSKQEGDDITINIHVNQKSIIHLIESQRRLVTIPVEALDYGRIEDAYVYKYIAYRIFLSHHKNKMLNELSIKRMKTLLNVKIELKKIRDYLNYLKDNLLIKDFQLTRTNIKWSFAGHKKENLVQMRDEGKQEIQKTKTEDVIDVENKLKLINDFNSKYTVTCGNKRLTTSLHAVYNNDDWQQGGRLYTSVNGYQSLKSDARKNIKINGKSTVEIDFSCLHPKMLYAEEGVDYNDDAYSFYSVRQVAKKALNIAINAKSKDEARAALKSYINDEGLIGNVEYIYDNMMIQHKTISKYFFSGVGTRLQHQDAKIALNILMTMRSKRICTLPVHDSFIVDKRFESVLTDVMKSEYHHVTGHNINVKTNVNAQHAINIMY